METIRELFSFLYDPQKLMELIRMGGYPILFGIVYAETGLILGFFLPGDSLLVTAGILAKLGYFDAAVLCGLLSFAAIIGDNTGYWIGRRTGPLVFRKPKSLLFNPSHVDRAQHFYERYGPKTVVLCRFVPIVRTFAPVVAGVGRMPYKRYLTYSVFGGILWITSMTLTGYFLGSIPGVPRYLHVVIGVVIFLSILPGIVEFLRERARKRKAPLAEGVSASKD